MSYYDAITIDGDLGDGSGVETVAEIVKIFEGEKGGQREGELIPIISISGDEITHQKEIYCNYNIAEFLQKPISREKLIETVISVII